MSAVTNVLSSAIESVLAGAVHSWVWYAILNDDVASRLGSTLSQTGLCVYEVDDPSQRSDAKDEGSRLRQRVAELEGVIREVGLALNIHEGPLSYFIRPQLKNKPHPRWVKSGSSPDEEFEKCHAHARSRSASEDSVVEARPPSTNSNVDSNEESSDKRTQSLLSETLQADYLLSPFSPPATGSSAPFSTLPYSPCFDIQSPVSAPSTGITTPTDEHPQMQVTVAEDQQLANDIDLASLFMSYPDLLACDEGLGNVDHVLRVNTNSQHVDPRSMKYNHGRFLDGHCGCLNEVASYNVVLELSLRLRKAADILSHSANHRFNNGCPLNRGIVDLDVFAT